ncbi:MAG: hypothetical protein AAF798_00145 [Bacteroidota bacterium]
MKSWKLLLQLASAVMLTIGFVACGDDDDGDCISCTLSYAGQTYTEQICEADFDTVEEFNQYIAALELLGGNCN